MIRLTILVLGIFLLVPTTPDDNLETSTTDAAFISMSTLNAVYNDLSRFCERNPDACESGAEIADIFQSKLKNGASMFAGYLDRSETEQIIDDVKTGSVN